MIRPDISDKGVAVKLTAFELVPGYLTIQPARKYRRWLDGHDVIDNVALRPSTKARQWMDGTEKRYAYRCLPMTMANMYGWEITCRDAFEAIWDGGTQPGATRIFMDNKQPDWVARSSVGYGIITIPLPALFRTEPGFDLMITGPFNAVKDGVAPLTGLLETDWSPYSFTMNWKITRPSHRVRFEKDEPIAVIFPVRRNGLAAFEPEIQSLDSDPALKEQWLAFTEKRKALFDQIADRSFKTWQANYFRGEYPDGAKAPIGDHQVRPEVPTFRRVEAAQARNADSGLEAALPDASASDPAAAHALHGEDASKAFVRSAQAQPFGSLSGKVVVSAMR
jgi:hypothetical protein